MNQRNYLLILLAAAVYFSIGLRTFAQSADHCSTNTTLTPNPNATITFLGITGLTNYYCIGTAISANVNYTNAAGNTTKVTTHQDCSTSTSSNACSISLITTNCTWTASVGSFSTNGTGTTASFTPTDCGSGSVSFHVAWSNACDNSTSSSNISGSFNVLSFNIADGGGKTISTANSNNVVIVGQSIGLTAQTCGGTFSNYQWTVTGTTESSFYVSSDPMWTNGYPVALTNTTNSSVSFFWVDAGSKSVSCAAVCGGVTCSTNVTFTVVRPTATVSAKTGIVALGNNIINSFYGVCFGTNGGPSGILFSNTLLMPTGYYNGGNTNYSIEWVQLLSTWNVSKTTPNSIMHSKNTAGVVLDTSYPYDTVNPTSDSPCVGTAGCISVSDTQKSEMWLMFQPSGGQWVPLRTVTWSMGGAAIYSGISWNLTSSSHSTNPPDADAGTTYPIWTNNAINPNSFPWTPPF